MIAPKVLTHSRLRGDIFAYLHNIIHINKFT